MSGESRFRRALHRLKDLLPRPWGRMSAAECPEPNCSSEPPHGPAEAPQASHSLQITSLGGAMVLVQLECRRVLIDAGPRRRTWWCWRPAANERPAVGHIEPIDAIVVTHRRGSELSPRLLQRLSRRTPVLVPTGLGESYCRIGFNQVVELRAGEQFVDGDLELTALPGTSERVNSSFWRTGAATWRGVVIRVGRALPKGLSEGQQGAATGGRTLWILESDGEGTDAVADWLTDSASPLPPDFVMALLIGEKPGWQRKHQGMRPEKAMQAFWLTGARVFIPFPVTWAQESPERLDCLVASIRSSWDCHPLSGRELMILRSGAVVEFPPLRETSACSP